jgi:hypothetical protein
MKTIELLDYIFDDPRSAFARRFATWVNESTRFKAFAETYRDKIRKKLRISRDPESRKDVELELDIARRLLVDRRFALEYEKYGTGKQRGPDFTVTFRTHTPFNVEVTRMRALAAAQVSEERSLAGRIATIISAKVGQMPPSIINVLVLSTTDPNYTPDDLESALKLLNDRVQQKDEEYFKRRGFLGSRDFSRQFARLSAILYLGPPTETSPAPIPFWSNRHARHPVPADISSALRATLTEQ